MSSTQENTAARVCCACGGGNTKVIYTQVKCVPVTVAPDLPPQIQISAQVEARETPCTEYRLGDPSRDEKRCRTPVVRGPCAPPFECEPLATDGTASFPRKLTETALLGAVSHVVIRNGGAHCAQKGMLSAVPVGGFGAGFVGRFEIAEAGTFRGSSGAITKVIVEEPGSGYQLPPKLVISEGGKGCMGAELEAVLSSDLFHAVQVFAGVGMDLQIIARDSSWDTISELAASGYATTDPEGSVEHPGYTDRQSGLPRNMARAVLYPPVVTQGGSVFSRRLRWVPLRSQGGAHPFLVCFTAQDSSGTTSASSNVIIPHKQSHGCIAVLLERCRYAVRPGETMQDIAAFYQTNWIQLWALNTDIMDPDGMLMEGSIVAIGHTYQVAEGDVIDWVVRKFGSSTAQVLFFP